MKRVGVCLAVGATVILAADVDAQIKKPVVPVVLDAKSCKGTWTCDKNGKDCTCVRKTAGGSQPVEFVCRTANDCANNMVCRAGYCRVPDGSCVVGEPASNYCLGHGECTPTSRGGRCTVVRFDGGAASWPIGSVLDGTIHMISPDEGDWLNANEVFSLRWQTVPGMLAPGVVTYAVISEIVPAVPGDIGFGITHPDPTINTNWASVRWVWSSAGRRNGEARIDEGFRGLRGASLTSPAFGAPWPAGHGLPTRMYVWFVYSVRGGRIVYASSLRQLRVGHYCDTRSIEATTCSHAATCTAVNDWPEQCDCPAGHCLRRCTSDLDCCGGGERCDFDTPDKNSPTGRRYGICRY